VGRARAALAASGCCAAGGLRCYSNAAISPAASQPQPTAATSHPLAPRACPPHCTGSPTSMPTHRTHHHHRPPPPPNQVPPQPQATATPLFRAGVLALWVASSPLRSRGPRPCSARGCAARRCSRCPSHADMLCNGHRLPQLPHKQMSHTAMNTPRPRGARPASEASFTAPSPGSRRTPVRQP
jgi:hypothetical protein